jgi:hypothetical protein
MTEKKSKKGHERKLKKKKKRGRGGEVERSEHIVNKVLEL